MGKVSYLLLLLLTSYEYILIHGCSYKPNLAVCPLRHLPLYKIIHSLNTAINFKLNVYSKVLKLI